MIGRREFCFGALALFATACKERVPVLKLPEDADECFDLFRFFTDPSFGLEQAKAGLGVTGEPKPLNDPKSRKLYTYENQTGILERIGFETGPDGRPDADKLTAIYVNYRTPIEVSLRRLEGYLGKSNRHDSKVPAPIKIPAATFTNLKPGQKEIERTSFSFFPDQPIAPGHLKGDLLFECDSTSWDTKTVDRLRYQRRV